MRINKELREYVSRNIIDLTSSSRKLGDVYRLMFRDNNLNIAETEENYRVRKYSFAEIRSYIEKAADELYSAIGASHGFVALEMENCVEWIVAFWAVLKSGNKPFLVNCRHTISLSQGILDTLEIKTIIGMDSTELKGDFVNFREIYARITSPDYVGAKGASANPGASNIQKCPDDVFEDELAISTSATSMHQSICFYGGAQISQQILDAEKILEECPRMASMYHGSIKQLAFLPFYHIFGLFAVFFWFGFFGRTFVFLKNYAPDTIVHTCRRHEVTHIFAVPALWHTVEKKILKEVSTYPVKRQKAFRTGLNICTKIQNISPYFGAKLAKYIMGEVTDSVFGQSIQFCISGGSYIMDSTLKLFNGLGYPLHNGYGMSEVGITSVELRQRPKDRNLNSVGHSFESIEYRINDAGQLEVKGTSISSRVMIDGVIQDRGEWFNTMDVVEHDGDYYFVKGRTKDIIIGDNGENISPDLTEKEFTIPEATNYACVGLKSDEGEVLSLVVQISDELDAEATAKIYSEVTAKNDTLPNPMRVRRFYFTKDSMMAKTAIKVSRPYLNKCIDEGSIKLIPMNEYVPQEKHVEAACNEEILKKVISIVATALEIDETEVDPKANIILDLGATSLQYFGVLSMISDEFGVETFSCNTVYDLVKYIEGQIS